MVHVRPVDPSKSRIVLAGAPHYRDPGLPDVPVIANNLADLAAAFTDPLLGGFPREHCVVAPPDAGVAEVGNLIVEAAEEAQDLLLFYYSGHGLLSPRRYELHLSLHATRPEQPTFTALPFASIRDAFLDSAAANRVVIIDSCFSGRAIGETLSEAEIQVLGQVEVAGTFTLTSAPANRTALVLPGERHTAFTERLLWLLHNGSPECGPMLSMGDIYRYLRRQLQVDGLPQPAQRGTDTAEHLGLIRNVRGRTEEALRDDGSVSISFIPMKPGSTRRVTRRFPDPGALTDRGMDVLHATVYAAADVPNPVVESGTLSSMAMLAAPLDWPKAVWLVEQAERATARIPEPAMRSRALTTILRDGGGVLTSRRAVRLATEARQLRMDSNDVVTRPLELAAIAGSLAVTAPDEAELFAADLDRDDADATAWARLRIVDVLADTQPDRAERIAQAIIEEEPRRQAMTTLARRWAGKDNALTARCAGEVGRMIDDLWRRDDLLFADARLVRFAEAVAPGDPDLVEALAERVFDLVDQTSVLGHVLTALADRDVRRAIALADRLVPRLLHLLHDDDSRAKWALARLAGAIALFDPLRAEAMAARIDDDGPADLAYDLIACAVVDVDPDHAQRCLDRISHPGRLTTALRKLVPIAAVTNPASAEGFALAITETREQIEAVAQVVRAAATTDPDRAERLADRAQQSAMQIVGITHRVWSLSDIAHVWLADPNVRSRRDWKW